MCLPDLECLREASVCAASCNGLAVHVVATGTGSGACKIRQKLRGPQREGGPRGAHLASRHRRDERGASSAQLAQPHSLCLDVPWGGVGETLAMEQSLYRLLFDCAASGVSSLSQVVTSPLHDVDVNLFISWPSLRWFSSTVEQNEASCASGVSPPISSVH